MELEASSERPSSSLIIPKHKKLQVLPCLSVFLLLSGAIFGGMMHAGYQYYVVMHDASREVCSNHGMKYDDVDACLCFDCWSGETCEQRLYGSGCVVQANSGTPLIFEDYWVKHPEARISIKSSFRIGYEPDAMPRLEEAIRSLHDLVGNAEHRGRDIVIGVGSTELIAAALYALAPDAQSPAVEQMPRGAGSASFFESSANGTSSSTGASGAAVRTAEVWSRKPYYSAYRSASRYFSSTRFAWNDSSTPPTGTALAPVIELVTSPNNPDGLIRTPEAPATPHTRVVMDHAYLWPHFTSIGSPVAYGNNTVVLFTLSKMTGHASTRIGWALSSDPEVTRRLKEFLSTVALGVPRENQVRAATAIEHVVAHDGQIFAYARARMLGRWRTLERIFDEARPDCHEGGTQEGVEGIATTLATSLAKSIADTTRNASGVPGPAHDGGISSSHAATFRLQSREPPSPDSYSGAESYEPSPAYAWVELLNDTMHGGDASTAMRSVGIVGRTGTEFGASRRFVRLELLMREQTFDILAEKLRQLVCGATHRTTR